MKKKILCKECILLAMCRSHIKRVSTDEVLIMKTFIGAPKRPLVCERIKNLSLIDEHIYKDTVDFLLKGMKRDLSKTFNMMKKKYGGNTYKRK